MTNLLLVHSSTDSGRVRDHNEDSVYPRPGELPEPIQHLGGAYQLLVVADGMGGHAKGDLASAAAIAALRDVLEHETWVEPTEALREAFSVANDRIHAEGDGRGSTLVAALVRLDSQEMWIANVGDSRIYLAADGKLTPLMRDHSKVADLVARGQLTNEQARTAPGRNVLTRAIGPDTAVEADVRGPLTLLPGQRLLLCSDGLYTMINEEQMMPLAWTAALDQAPGALVEAANAAGGQDNVTVLIAALPQAETAHAGAAVPGAVAAASVANGVVAAPASRPGGVKVLGRRVSVPVLAAVLAALFAGAGLAAALLLGGGDGKDKASKNETPGAAAASTPRAARTSTPGAAASESASAAAATTESATAEASAASTTPGTATPPTATVTPRLPTATPVPGAPTVSNLNCSPTLALIDAEVTCSATIVGAATIRWTSAGNPGDRTGGEIYMTRFDAVGVKRIRVEACNSAAVCAAPTFDIEVRAAATATPTQTATATATTAPPATPTPTAVSAPPGPAPQPPPGPGPGGFCPPILPNCP